MAYDKNKDVRRGVFACLRIARKKQAFRRRHWPANFLWSSPANAGWAVGVLTAEIPAAPPMANRTGKASLLELWHERLAKVLTASF